MYYGGRKESEPDYRPMLSNPKEGSKPSDVRNGDLVSLLLAATPPYLYNMPLVPQSFFFSEMLRSFVQAKTERQNLKTHQVHRRRKRTWREASPSEADKPLELTTARAPEKPPSPPPAKKSTPSCDFTAETLANSSVNGHPPQPPQGAALPPEIPTAPSGLPLWYPNTYPNQLPYPIDPLHFFIDLRVSAHIWDRKVEAEKQQLGSAHQRQQDVPPETSCDRFDFGKNRHKSAFSVPEHAQPHRLSTNQTSSLNKQSVHYIMSHINSIFQPKEKKENVEGEKSEEEKIDKKDDDLRALIGLELVVDYVKQETDNSDDEDDDVDEKEIEERDSGGFA